MSFVRGMTIEDLGAGAAAALGILRMAAAGRCRCCAALPAPEATELGGLRLAALAHALARSLGVAGGRAIVLGTPACRAVAVDELGIIAMLAAAQAGDVARRNAHVAWLAAGKGEIEIRGAAEALAEAFIDAGMAIEIPTTTPRVRAAAQ